MTLLVLAPLLLAAQPLDDGAVRVTATISAPTIESGQSYEIEFAYHLGEGVSISGAGLPAPILQIKAPPSAELAGDEITDLKALAKNEFLRTPYERLLDASTARIAFTLTGQPGADEAFSLNLVGYVKSSDGASHFVRRRAVLPLAGNAESKAAAPTPADWGRGDTLAIGDNAADFDLPRADGSRVSLAPFRGKKNVIVTTYRAHW